MRVARTTLALVAHRVPSVGGKQSLGSQVGGPAQSVGGADSVQTVKIHN